MQHISNYNIPPEAFTFGLSSHKNEIVDKTNILPMIIHYFKSGDDFAYKYIGDPDKDPEACINREFKVS